MVKYHENLKIKTIVADSAKEMDEKCMEFRKNNIIKATQCNPVFDFQNKQIVFIYTLFYFPKTNVPKPEEEKKVKKEKEYLDERKIKVSESEAKWATCKKCGTRWKWTHFKMCRNSHGIEGLPDKFHEQYKKIWE